MLEALGRWLSTAAAKFLEISCRRCQVEGPGPSKCNSALPLSSSPPLIVHRPLSTFHSTHSLPSLTPLKYPWSRPSSMSDCVRHGRQIMCLSGISSALSRSDTLSSPCVDRKELLQRGDNHRCSRCRWPCTAQVGPLFLHMSTCGWRDALPPRAQSPLDY